MGFSALRAGMLLAALALAFSAPAAHAGSDQEIRTDRGQVAFDHHGEWLTACDENADGYGVRAYLRWSSTKSAQVTDYDSYGGATLCESKNLSIPEGTTVWLTMCYTDNRVDVKCSKSQRAVA
jgi:hypothetical protein